MLPLFTALYAHSLNKLFHVKHWGFMFPYTCLLQLIFPSIQVAHLYRLAIFPEYGLPVPEFRDLSF